MMNPKSFHLAALVAACALAAGCSSTKLDSDVPVESRTTTGGTAGAGAGAGAGANAGGTPQSQVASVDLTKSTMTVPSNLPRLVYFDFDSYVVKDEFRPVVEANAKALTTDRKRHLVVEGHTDERGGHEYNLALGQKRAEAVVKSLELMGANDNQLEAVSFGKERPAVQGSDEAAWAKNRRAELVPR
jgi:peptidoglycan-associated lipoprotein